MQKLRAGAAHFGLTLTAAQMDAFAAFWDLLEEKNKHMNLTAIKDKEEAEERHFLDSLALVQLADFRGKRVIDIGTGAGFPGVPLKIAIETMEITLLDALQKRIQFLDEVVSELALKEIHPQHARAEEWASEAGERAGYDYAVSRAVARLNVLTELALPFVKEGGAFFAMKALDSDEEIEEAKTAIETLGGALEKVHDYLVPGTGVTRRIVCIRKIRATDEKYPRRFAKIQKKPL